MARQLHTFRSGGHRSEWENGWGNWNWIYRSMLLRDNEGELIVLISLEFSSRCLPIFVRKILFPLKLSRTFEVFWSLRFGKHSIFGQRGDK